MTITQRELDLAQLEAELKMQAVFDEWRRSFLAERFQQPPQQTAVNPPSLQQQGAVNPPLITEEEEIGTVR